MIDPQLLSYATARQVEYLETVEQQGSYRKAAAVLGVNHRTIERSLQSLASRAARSGYSPQHDMTKTVPAGFRVKGVSTFYDENGKPRSQWVKSAVDPVAQEALMRAAYEAMADDLERVAPTKPPQVSYEQLATLYTFTDCHVGMLSWGQETGADWDLEVS